jgi:flagellar biosynthetic protein FlhB
MSDADKNHAATPHKLEKAKERGQVPKSRDVVSATVFTVAMAYLAWRGWPVWREQLAFDQALLQQAAHVDPTAQNLWLLVERTVRSTLWLGVPFFAALLLAAVVANVAQTGAVFAVAQMKFDFTRLNPATNFKNVFSAQLLFNALRTVLKLLLLSVTAWFVLQGVTAQMPRVGSLSPLGLLRALLDSFASLGLKLAVVLWCIALLDLVFARRRFAKKMRMSSKEFKDEIKQREGDPRVRSRLRELRREMRKRSQSVRNTRKADVLITNPTHVAIALRYEHGKMAAPELVAKGSGVLAAAMRAIAARHAIPVVQSPSLARKLFRELEVQRPLPPEHFAEVARIIVWVLAMKQPPARAMAGGAR